MMEQAGECGAPVARRGALRLAGSLAAVAALLLSPVAGGREAVPPLEEIVAQMVRVNPGLRTFTSEQVVDIRVFGIPVRVRSTLYAARPARYKIVFHNLPALLARAGDAFAQAARPEQLLEDYRVVAGEVVYEGGRRLYHLTLQGRRADVNPPSGEMWVDAQTWLVPRMVLNYEWAVLIATYTFVEVEGHMMPGVIAVAIPRFRISARMTFLSYRFNVALLDDLFVPARRETTTDQPARRPPDASAR